MNIEAMHITVSVRQLSKCNTLWQEELGPQFGLHSLVKADRDLQVLTGGSSAAIANLVRMKHHWVKRNREFIRTQYD